MAAKYPFSVDGNGFQGKRVLVTGGTKGMGEAVVRRLTMVGGSVETIALSPLPKGQQPAPPRSCLEPRTPNFWYR
jgi:hypothetical protein